ncbi:MAG: N-acetyl-gamma-glutamyl-phosphate reductase [Kiritimatiellia bacterium]|nr:N-acetyl-gamma-glutamyl-phosphate reductase [Kiritimatiellia bacterium]
MIKAKIVGAGGYGGVGIIELLLGHEQAEIACLADINDVGAPISRLYPHLAGFCDMPIISVSDSKASEPVDVVFLATPDGVGMKSAESELKRGAKVIDYSGDFRFNTPAAYADYAGRIGRETVHNSAHLLPEAVYGLAELHRNELNKETRIVGNPGCFAVSCILGLAPVVKQGIVRLDSIICDCKTGVSGAGKKPSAAFHYPARYDHMNAYKLAGHQHVCEIEREFSILSGQNVKVTFTAQVVPVCRGIMSTLYGELNKKLDCKALIDLYKDFYGNSVFVRIYDRDSGIGTVHVRGTNFCKLIVDLDERTNRVRIVSHIDNLLKGQAGSALQNMNLIFGLAENEGLCQAPKYP